jgi:hypothetical protein
VGTTLHEKSVDIRTIEQYKNLGEELKKYGLYMDHPHILLSILPKFKAMGYDPKRIKSMKRMERRLKEYVFFSTFCYFLYNNFCYF